MTPREIKDMVTSIVELISGMKTRLEDRASKLSEEMATEERIGTYSLLKDLSAIRDSGGNWGFGKMPTEEIRQLLEQVIARLSRNQAIRFLDNKEVDLLCEYMRVLSSSLLWAYKFEKQ